MTRHALTGCRIALLAVLLIAAAPALAGGDWNDAGIGWVDFEKGLTTAKASQRPILLVVYTEWCPHCTNYAKLFHDPKIVEQSKKFVMVRVDKDKNKELSAKYAPDGEYIPRTYFLAPDGTLDASVTANPEKWKYFYNEQDPAPLVASMERVAKPKKP